MVAGSGVQAYRECQNGATKFLRSLMCVSHVSVVTETPDECHLSGTPDEEEAAAGDGCLQTNVAERGGRHYSL